MKDGQVNRLLLDPFQQQLTGAASICTTSDEPSIRLPLGRLVEEERITNMLLHFGKVFKSFQSNFKAKFDLLHFRPWKFTMFETSILNSPQEKQISFSDLNTSMATSKHNLLTS